MPDEKGRVRLYLSLHEFGRLGNDLVVESLHAFGIQNALVFRLAIGGARYDAAHGPLFRERLGLRSVGVFGVLIRVEVVEIAEKLVETVTMRQMFLAVAKMVLAELGSGIAMHLQYLCDSRIFRRHTLRRACTSHGGQPGARRHLAGDKRRAACGARWLRIERSQLDPVRRDLVDIRGRHTHDVSAETADIGIADIVAENDEYVGLLFVWHGRLLSVIGLHRGRRI